MKGAPSPRTLWALILVALCAVLWFGIDWLMGLSEPVRSLAQVGILLALVCSAVGVVFPARAAEPIQGILLLVGLLYVISYFPMYL